MLWICPNSIWASLYEKICLVKVQPVCNKQVLVNLDMNKGFAFGQMGLFSKTWNKGCVCYNRMII